MTRFNPFPPLAVSLLLCITLSFITHTEPVVTISSPVAKKVYKLRDTIWIKAGIKSEEALHDVVVKVISLKDSSEIFAKQFHSHSNSMSINEYFINPMYEKGSMKLSIYTVGHDRKEAGRKDVVFSSSGKKK